MTSGMSATGFAEPSAHQAFLKPTAKGQVSDPMLLHLCRARLGRRRGYRQGFNLLRVLDLDELLSVVFAFTDCGREQSLTGEAERTLGLQRPLVTILNFGTYRSRVERLPVGY